MKLMLFVSIGGITALLPLMFIKSEKMTVKNLSLMFGLFSGMSVIFSGIVAIGANCGFLETLFMKGSQCNFLPFANTRTVPVTNTLAFIFIVLMVIAAIRDAIFKLTRKQDDKAL
ncbi:MAG: hypothetical protein H6995_12950 [Pseudomonadales bacterium]|nr:hypothetical protein [Pseudomonadales bacterium]